MACWNGRDHSQYLEAALHWKQHCFVGNGSALTEKSLWDLNKLSRLLITFRESPLFDRRSFIEKLEAQLRDAKPALKQLASEIIWLLLLFVSNSQMGASAKRERISRIWSLSGEPLPQSRWMDDRAPLRRC